MKSPPRSRKGVKDAQKQMKRVNLKGGTDTRIASSAVSVPRGVVMLPASPGTGVIAVAPSAPWCRPPGSTDILTKSYGSTNKLNLVKAAIDALTQLRTKDEVARLRGVSL